MTGCMRWMVWLIVGLLVLVQEGGGHPWNGQVGIASSRGNPYRGRLQFAWHHRWGTVCNHGFRHRSARPVCRQLNLIGGWRVGHYQHHTCHWMDHRYMCGGWHARCPYIWLCYVNCRGGERRIMDCPHWPYGWHNCHHHKDVMIQCHPPPLWLIEWEYNDEEEKSPWRNGHVAHYGVQFYQSVTPNALNRCWPWWRAQSKVKILKYTEDSQDAESPVWLDAYIHRAGWPMGWVEERWRIPGLYFDVRGAHCDMERIRAVQCDYKNAKININIDWTNSYCWESKPRVPQEMQNVFLQDGINLTTSSSSGSLVRPSESKKNKSVTLDTTTYRPFAVDTSNKPHIIKKRVPMANVVHGHLGPPPQGGEIIDDHNEDPEHKLYRHPSAAVMTAAPPTKSFHDVYEPVPAHPPNTLLPPLVPKMPEWDAAETATRESDQTDRTAETHLSVAINAKADASAVDGMVRQLEKTDVEAGLQGDHSEAAMTLSPQCEDYDASPSAAELTPPTHAVPPVAAAAHTTLHVPTATAETALQADM